MRKIGIEVGKSFDISKLDPAVQKALESAPEAGQKLMAWKLPTLARVANGWSMNTTRWVSTATIFEAGHSLAARNVSA